MKKGGYQILDLKDVQVEENVASTIKGIYGTIEGTRKPIYVSGLNVGGLEIRDAYVDFLTSSADYVGLMGAYTLTIKADDTLTVKKNKIANIL